MPKKYTFKAEIKNAGGGSAFVAIQNFGEFAPRKFG